MKTIKNFSLVLTLIASVIFFSASVFAQEDPVKNKEQNQSKEANTNPEKDQTQKQNQITETILLINGDGFNDNAPDADGDGIPNGRDEDYTVLRTEKEQMDQRLC